MEGSAWFRSRLAGTRGQSMRSRPALKYPDPPSITSFAHETGDTPKEDDEASQLQNLLIVGASPMMFHGETLQSNYITSPAHIINDSLGGRCSDQILQIPDTVLSKLVNNTLEDLKESDWKLIQDSDPIRQRQGLSAFTAGLKVSAEAWGNSYPREEPPTRAQTARTSNVRLHSGYHPLPMNAIHFQPTWQWEDPPNKPSVVFVTDTQGEGSRESLAHVSAILPFSVNYPEDTFLGVNSPQLKLTGNKEFCTKVVSDMNGLEPVLRSVMAPWMRGEEGVTEEDVREKIGSILEADLKTRIKYNSSSQDYERKSSTTRAVMTDPAWTIGSNEDGPPVRVRFRPGREQRSSPPTVTQSLVGTPCASAF